MASVEVELRPLTDGQQSARQETAPSEPKIVLPETRFWTCIVLDFTADTTFDSPVTILHTPAMGQMPQLHHQLFAVPASYTCAMPGCWSLPSTCDSCSKRLSSCGDR